MKNFLTKDEMENLNTKRLLAYKRMLLKFHDEPNWETPLNLNGTKKNPAWLDAYNNTLAILGTRENMEKKRS